MAEIAHRIELYNQASQLARTYIAKDSTLVDRAGIAKQLHEAVRHAIAAGNDDVVTIAAAAVRELRAHYGAAQEAEPKALTSQEDV
jgi:hypothetical protein